MNDAGRLAAQRLTADEIARNFSDIHPPLDRKRALVEASRCYFCYDAPCTQACPTGIDIPGFIRKITTDNVKGAATTILGENIMGGACARVCPVEILCESACVRQTQESKPIQIGALQRYATDWLFDHKVQPFTRAAATGKRVAVVGAGPAGLACAHRLARHGHDVTIFEARPKAGGLNEYGIAAYKMTNDFAQTEAAFILGIGGIRIEFGKALGRDVRLADLRRDFDAMFLGLGLAGANALALEGEDMAGVMDAVAYIERLRQTADKSALEIGRRVVVIGGGNTAIDIAVQAKRLGAQDVTIVYRRGPQHMTATGYEQELAQTNGVAIKYWARPIRLVGQGGRVREVEFEYTQLDEQGRLMSTNDRFTLLADMAFKAIGQTFVAAPLEIGAAEPLELAGSRIAVNADRQTSLPNVWAGGDCVPGDDLTVSAVQDGKVAAEAINRALRSA
ncbi:glutamate synthase (NADPH/NADH) small chain [Enhydrobacter aerosaccus]|uniref:Glutamate synthase (NADPH/NADH) small chain n=1 Tax=Enhydrobacter aerosaccus TaxID=225324 RepID=A0A1T4N4M3_9HYPH|nr:NAD(P)-dependent oxidoreductase [Enhydrobacter aerosaccus]SJZ74041.1 glutamate synthase (NADPH/NADH) small chain [Enhydrobacter aerosaccus]